MTCYQVNLTVIARKIESVKRGQILTEVRTTTQNLGKQLNTQNGCLKNKLIHFYQKCLKCTGETGETVSNLTNEHIVQSVQIPRPFG